MFCASFKSFVCFNMFLEIHALNFVVWKSMALYQELETSFPDVKLTLNPSTCYFRQT